MNGRVHQLFSSEADRQAAWDRYAELARQIEGEPALLSDRGFMERLWAAEREAKRLFNAQLEREARG